MSVIWSGVTEEGAVVPVQVTAEGKVIAVGDGPEGDYLKLTGGNLTGDLTLGPITQSTLSSAPNISLKADGMGIFQDSLMVGANGRLAEEGLRVETNTPWNSILENRNNASGDRVLYTVLGANARNGASTHIECNIGNVGPVAAIFGDGSAWFSNSKIKLNEDGSADLANSVRIGGQFGNPAISLNAAGSASFSGDVVIGSRGEQWLIRESNGVAMLVKQTLLKQPREEKLRDLPNELDLIETALNEIMEKLRMTPPAGWPVWDGSDNA